mgnify:CR=1 FL=1
MSTTNVCDMDTPVAVYLQDAHPIREGMEIAKYAEAKGFHAVWQAESRLVREATVPMAAFASVCASRVKCANRLGAPPADPRQPNLLVLARVVTEIYLPC